MSMTNIDLFFFSFFNHFKNNVIIAIFIIIVSLYGIYFILQDVFEDELLRTLFEDQSKKQFDANKALSEHISSDLTLLLAKLETISKSVFIQNGDYSNHVIDQSLGDFYNNNPNMLGRTDLLFISDEKGIIKSIYPNSDKLTKSLFLPSTANTFTSNYANLPFKDISSQNYFKQVKEFRKPLFLSGQSMLDSKDNLYSNNSNNYANRIIISNPIINEISGKFVGLIGISLSTSDFFKRLGNIYDIRSQYMSVLDNNATHLVHSNVNLVGKNFFDDYTQTFTK